MSDQFLGEIRVFSGNYAPKNWAFCNGQLLAIANYEALYMLIGTTFGGDGTSTFALPDLRGRVAMHQSPDYGFASNGGTETVTLTEAQLPAHTHAVIASNEPGTLPAPGGNTFWANSTLSQYSTTMPPNGAMSEAAISTAGLGLPHDNMMPTMALNYIIALQGIFPEQS